MIEPKHLESSMDTLWRRSGDSPPEHEVAVVTAAQLARIAAALEEITKRLRNLELVVQQQDLR